MTVALNVAEGMTVVANEGVKVATTGIVSPLALVVVYVKGVAAPAAPVGPGCPTGPCPPPASGVKVALMSML
jgi:hypothetical protein